MHLFFKKAAGLTESIIGGAIEVHGVSRLILPGADGN